MGKQRLRKWISDNQFFQYKGQFSKSAFIAMSTWFVVMAKYVASGLSVAYTKAASVILGVAIPASVVTYVVKFDSGEAMALLSLVFGLYFGGKFSPNNKEGERKEGEGERRDMEEKK